MASLQNFCKSTERTVLLMYLFGSKIGRMFLIFKLIFQPWFLKKVKIYVLIKALYFRTLEMNVFVKFPRIPSHF